jgi:competence protein ComEA
MKRCIILLILCVVLMPTMAAEPKAKKGTPVQKPDKPSGRAQVAAKSLTPAQKTKLLTLLNQGDAEALQSLPGIGATRAAAIMKARPVLEPVDLVRVEGIGEETLVEIVAHVQAGFPSKIKDDSKPKATSKTKTAKNKPK